MKLAEGDTPVTQRIRGLEEKLQGTQERVEEVLAQRKTYEQIAKRLREDRNGLDPQARCAAPWHHGGPLTPDPSSAAALLGALADRQDARRGGAHTAESRRGARQGHGQG